MKPMKLKGKYADAKIFTQNVDGKAIGQVYDLLNDEVTKGSKLRFMPDIHPGKGCVIGTTMTINDKIVPNLVGVDIACGIIALFLGSDEIDLVELDRFVRNNIPHGRGIHQTERSFPLLDELRCINHVDKSRALRSIGSLGGGNHYIEVGQFENYKGIAENVLTIHTGSRHLGQQIATHYQNKAELRMAENKRLVKEAHHLSMQRMKQMLIDKGRQREIPDFLKQHALHLENANFAYLKGQDMDDYLHDVAIAQKYASANRKAIADAIVGHLQKVGHTFNNTQKTFETIHNYIDIEHNILRKGAVSAQTNEVVIIPINMRDGALLAKGLGNPDWNYSAPHGAGRLFSRGEAKSQITLEEFQNSMKGIYSTSVRQDTIDESAFAYKPMDEIIENTKDTIEILAIIKPIYNFKA